jgi:hypothetical protein
VHSIRCVHSIAVFGEGRGWGLFRAWQLS